jgi:hypothetical protein
MPLLAMGIMIAVAGSAHAQDRQYQAPGGASATLRITFGSAPHWTGISGTRVEEIPMAERPDHDVFRYGGTYYAYDRDRWYSSRRESGDFTAIDDRDVPRELSTVPREHWRTYPNTWQDQNQNQGRYQGQQAGRYQPDQSSGMRVEFSSRPHWGRVSGTRVWEIRTHNRPSYDLFSYNGAYYAYDNERWYMSQRSSGDFRLIDDHYVPAELYRVPRNHWRSYPVAWDRDGRSGNGGHEHQQHHGNDPNDHGRH